MATRTETQSIEIDAAPEAVLAITADPRRLPDWAPAFADTVEGSSHSGWRVTKSGSDFSLRVATSDAGTVDYLREIAPGREGGAYTRVVPRPGGGSVLLMTLPIPPGVEASGVSATLESELQALAKLAEGG